MSRAKRVHVVGSSPRSGTTLAFELLTSCFEIEKFGDHEISLFEHPRDPADPYASKQPMDFVHVQRVLAWDRDLYCIYMERDPRDIIVSQHGSRPGEYWCDYPVWARNRRLLDGLGPHPRLYVCRYEDLAADPDAEQARLAAAFPFLRKAHAFSEFDRVSQSSEAAQLALKGVRKISTKSVGTWRANLPRVAAQLQAHPGMAQGVVAAGYAESTEWTQVCEGVAPDNSESVRARHNVLRETRGSALALARIRRRLSTLGREVGYVLRRRLS